MSTTDPRTEEFLVSYGRALSHGLKRRIQAVIAEPADD